MSNITFQHLKVFQSIMRAGSLTGAAKTLNRTQPAVSASLKVLEAQLGITLFEKQGSKLIPSAEARFLFHESDQILEKLESTKDILSRLRKGLAGELKIACMPAASQILIPSVLARFLTDRPSVNLSFLTRTSDTTQKWIASQQFDLGISETPGDTSELFFSRDFVLPCLLAFRKDSALGRLKIIRSQDLCNENYIGLLPEHPITQQLAAHMTSNGKTLNQRIHLQTMIPAFTFLESGLGYSVVDPLSAESYRLINRNSNLTFRRFWAPIDYSISILIPRYRDKSIIVDELAEQLRQEIERLKHSFVDE